MEQETKGVERVIGSTSGTQGPMRRKQKERKPVSGASYYPVPTSEGGIRRAGDSGWTDEAGQRSSLKKPKKELEEAAKPPHRVRTEAR